MRKAVKFAFIQSIPVFLGYLFLGMAFGLLLNDAGYGVVWAFFISLTVYAGSGQFLLVSFLSSGASLLSSAFMTLSVNSRHIFYGLSFIERFKEMGKAYLYMIFSLTDETYSLLCGTKIPEDIDKNKAMLAVAVLDQCYWIFGSVLGNLLGEVLPFSTEGVDFAMTALFTVIFVEQWLSLKNHIPVFIGVVSAVVCLAVFGADNFILPTLLLCVAGLMVFRRKVGEVQ